MSLHIITVYLNSQRSQILRPDMSLNVKHVRRKNLPPFLPTELADQVRTFNKKVSLIIVKLTTAVYVLSRQLLFIC